MSVLTRERETTRIPERRRFGWMMVLPVLGIAAVAASGLTVALSGGEEAAPAPVSVVPAVVDSDLIAGRLANQGLIPMEAVDWERVEMQRLANQGLIPKQALIPKTEEPESLYTPEERAIMDAVRRGEIPKAVLDGEPFLTKRLINQGLLPKGAAGE